MLCIVFSVENHLFRLSHWSFSTSDTCAMRTSCESGWHLGTQQSRGLKWKKSYKHTGKSYVAYFFLKGHILPLLSTTHGKYYRVQTFLLSFLRVCWGGGSGGIFKLFYFGQFFFNLYEVETTSLSCPLPCPNERKATQLFSHKWILRLFSKTVDL